MRAITFPQLSLPAPSPPEETEGTSPVLSRQQGGFDTMETQFFREGDELSTPPPAGEGCEEHTAVHQRQRGLGTWVVLVAAFVLGMVLAIWRASS